jgi:hypothetical protein
VRVAVKFSKIPYRAAVRWLLGEWMSVAGELPMHLSKKGIFSSYAPLVRTRSVMLRQSPE